MEYVTLDRQALSVLGMARKEKTRYAMQGVHVDKHGVTATDGKILGHVTHGKLIIDQEPITISADTCKALLKDIGRGKNERPYKLDNLEATRDNETHNIDTVSGEFPPYRDVMDPTEHLPHSATFTEIGFDPYRMIQLCKALIAFKGKNVAGHHAKLKIANGNPLAGISFEATNGDRTFTGVLMPVNLAATTY